MKQVNVKKLILPNIPYVFIALLATKVSEAVRLAPGSDASTKLLNIMTGLNTAFHSLVPSFHPIDLCVGVAAAIAIRLAVYIKGKNAKKFRKNLEYGSARWGKPEDIAPYVDPKFENNVILTQTERLMMSNRPKDPKTARNKNVLVVGGSGSGNTRFFIKPNLMQLHSSYVVTDPNGYTRTGRWHRMRKASAPRKLSPDVSRRLSDSRRQSAALTLREIHCPFCSFLVEKVFSDAAGHKMVYCRKCKSEYPINLGCFRRMKAKQAVCRLPSGKPRQKR